MKLQRRKRRTRPQVFIIESLRFKDERHGLFEGRQLATMLELSGKVPEYVYIRTRKELKAVLEHFWASNYRYLHLSCHGNDTEMATTLDDIPFNELGQILEPYLEKRRLFVSACEMTCPNFAQHLLPATGCYSILGPAEKPSISDAAVFWAAFYHLVFRVNPNAINAARLLATAQRLSTAFALRLNYYAPAGKSFKGTKIRP